MFQSTLTKCCISAQKTASFVTGLWSCSVQRHDHFKENKNHFPVLHWKYTVLLWHSPYYGVDYFPFSILIFLHLCLIFTVLMCMMNVLLWNFLLFRHYKCDNRQEQNESRRLWASWGSSNIPFKGERGHSLLPAS